MMKTVLDAAAAFVNKLWSFGEKIGQPLTSLVQEIRQKLRELAPLDARTLLALAWKNRGEFAALWVILGLVLAIPVMFTDPFIWSIRGKATLGGFLFAICSFGFLTLLLPGLLLAAPFILLAVVVWVALGPLALAVLAIALPISLAVTVPGKIVSTILDALTKGDDVRAKFKLLKQTTGVDGSRRDLDGKPRMMEGDELATYEAANLANQRGAPLLLGRVNGKPFTYWTEKHVYLTASSRSGKGRDLIIPNLLRYPESVFVLDPKGENCRATAATRAGLGNTIAAFDPYGLSGQPGARFNPLAGLQGDELVTGADYLAEALVIGPNDHWNESARGLLRALVLHIVTASDEQLRGRARDLVSLRELLTGFLDLTLEEMRENPALDGLVSRLAESFIGVPPNERGGIVSTARRGTKWLDNPTLADMFRAGEGCIGFDALRDPAQRLSVFVCLPAHIFTTYPQVCRLLSTFALDTMMRSLTGRARPVMFILDELAQLDHLPIVQRAFTLGAGFGIQVWAVFQSVEQARKLYPLDSLYGSAGVRCFFKVEDPESCTFASKCASDVLAPADVRHLPDLGMLTLLDGANPLYVERLGPQSA